MSLLDKVLNLEEPGKRVLNQFYNPCYIDELTPNLRDELYFELAVPGLDLLIYTDVSAPE